MSISSSTSRSRMRNISAFACSFHGDSGEIEHRGTQTPSSTGKMNTFVIDCALFICHVVSNIL